MRVQFTSQETIKDHDGYRRPGSVGEVSAEYGAELIRAGLAIRASEDAVPEPATEKPQVALRLPEEPAKPAPAVNTDEEKASEEAAATGAADNEPGEDILLSSLKAIPGVTEQGAKAMIEAGVTALEDVKSANSKDLAAVLKVSKKEAEAIQKAIT